MSDVYISLVVCTRNRAVFLADTLPYYRKMQCGVPWELIVVNNRSTDNTQTVIEQFKSNEKVNVRIEYERRVGLSYARNTGWRAAKGKIIAFTDDDCYPSTNYLDEIVNIFAEKEIDYMGGRVLLFDPEDRPICLNERSEEVDIDPGQFLSPGLIQGANMAIRKAVLEELDGFDELLGAGTPYPSEDTDLLGRASAAGFRGAYDPRPIVFHHHRRRTDSQVRSVLQGYRRGAGAYYMKCLSNRSSRKSAARAWYWSTRNRIAMSRRSPQHLLFIFDELRGGIGYAIDSVLHNRKYVRRSDE